MSEPSSSHLSRDLAYQRRILPAVSRTFALTIPQLPPALRDVVANAYLLCRIADTIEDDVALNQAQKDHYAQQFTRVVAGVENPRAFADELPHRLGSSALEAERELVAHAAQVVRLTHSFSPTQQAALLRCVRVMSAGMAEFQRHASPLGLPDVAALNRYCYYVAGVVGEMLTELFCEYSPEFARHGQSHLRQLAVSFGQGLQMTNILKDIWDDQERGMCWLPQDVFRRAGFDLARLQHGQYHPAFGEGLGELVGVARLHLAQALDYVLLIPPAEAGLRRFCLWAIGMAVLTLRRIERRRDFRSGAQVKISRRSVKVTVLLSNLLTRQDWALRLVFRLLTRDLPSPSLALTPDTPT